MTGSVQTLSFYDLIIAFIPVIVVIAIIFKWKLNYSNAIYAITRMLIQLLLVGYILAFLFSSNSAWIIVCVLLAMIFFSSWIALGTIKTFRKVLFVKAFIAILISGGATLCLVIIGVLDLEPWHSARYSIPLAGMIFASSMNSISLAAERLNAELNQGQPYDLARNIAFNTSIIPITNSLLAVGLVSLPGMMTGQILSGISPFIAAKYQIMVMCMIFGSGGLSSACFLLLAKPIFNKNIQS